MPRRLLPVLLLALVGCGPRHPTEIRIGVLATLTGSYAEISGRPTVEGARLAVRDAGPMVLGGRTYRVTLIERDFADRAEAAAAAARQLINQDSVVAIVGPQFSRHAIPVAVLAEDAGVPMISPMSSSPEVTAGKRFVFRLAFLDDVQASVMARFAIEELRARSASILYEVSTAYSRQLAERFQAAFAAQGGRVVAMVPYTADQQAAMGPLAARAASARADVVFLPNFPDQVRRQVPEFQRRGAARRLLGSDSWDPQSLPRLAEGERAFVTNQWRPDIPLPSVAAFTARYQAAYGTAPRATAAMSYDAVRILLDAIGRAGTLEAEAVRSAIAATREWAGASGVVTFGGRADPVRAVAVSEVRDGGLTTLRLVEP